MSEASNGARFQKLEVSMDRFGGKSGVLRYKTGFGPAVMVSGFFLCWEGCPFLR
jgi:hypothetical protein